MSINDLPGKVGAQEFAGTIKSIPGTQGLPTKNQQLTLKTILENATLFEQALAHSFRISSENGICRFFDAPVEIPFNQGTLSQWSASPIYTFGGPDEFAADPFGYDGASNELDLDYRIVYNNINYYTAYVKFQSEMNKISLIDYAGDKRKMLLDFAARLPQMLANKALINAGGKIVYGEYAPFDANGNPNKYPLTELPSIPNTGTLNKLGPISFLHLVHMAELLSTKKIVAPFKYDQSGTLISNTMMLETPNNTFTVIAPYSARLELWNDPWFNNLYVKNNGILAQDKLKSQNSDTYTFGGISINFLPNLATLDPGAHDGEYTINYTGLGKMNATIMIVGDTKDICKQCSFSGGLKVFDVPFSHSIPDPLARLALSGFSLYTGFFITDTSRVLVAITGRSGNHFIGSTNNHAEPGTPVPPLYITEGDNGAGQPPQTDTLPKRRK